VTLSTAHFVRLAAFASLEELQAFKKSTISEQNLQRIHVV